MQTRDLIFYGVFLGVSYGIRHFMRTRRAQARAQLQFALATDPYIEPTNLGVFSFRTREPYHPADIEVAGERTRNRHPYWRVTTKAKTLGLRTSLSLSREGPLGALREAAGIKDIHVGNAEFDKAYTLRGNEPGLLRMIFSRPETQRAVARAFSTTALQSFNMEHGGAIECQAAIQRKTVDEARLLLLAVAKLAADLDQATAAEMKEPA